MAGNVMLFSVNRRRWKSLFHIRPCICVSCRSFVMASERLNTPWQRNGYFQRKSELSIL